MSISSMNRNNSVRNGATRVIAAGVAVLFFLASCQWAPNQSGSDVTIQISHDAVVMPSSTSGDGTHSPGILEQMSTISGLSSVQSQASALNVGSLELAEGDELDEFSLFFGRRFDRESGVFIYYVEEEYLASQGALDFDLQSLLEAEFERRYGRDMFTFEEPEFDEEAYIEFIIDFFYRELGILLDPSDFDEERELEEGEDYDDPFADLSEEEALEFFFKFFIALFEFLFQPIIALFSFIEDIYARGITLQEQLPGGVGGFAARIRGGSIFDSTSSTSFTFRNLQPGATYLVIAGYIESEFETEENGFPNSYEMFGFGRLTMEEGVVRSLRVPLTLDRFEAENQLNTETGGAFDFVTLFEFDSLFAGFDELEFDLGGWFEEEDDDFEFIPPELE